MSRITPEIAARYYALAAAQRGAPEAAMGVVQRAAGGGVLSAIAEHGGDVMHRMNEWFGMPHGTIAEHVARGRWPTREKALKVLRWFGYQNDKMLDLGLSVSANDFIREHTENMANNARYHGVPLAKYTADVRAALRAYAAEHAKLGAYNEPQRLARDAAVAVGEERWRDAARAYAGLVKLASDPEAWTHAMEPDNDEEDDEGERPVERLPEEDIATRVAALAADWHRLYYGQPKTRAELQAFLVDLDARPYAEIAALYKAAHGKGPFAKVLFQIREQYEGARRWIRKEFLARADGSPKNATLGTRVVLVRDQRQYAKTDQGPVPKSYGVGTVEEAGSANAAASRAAVGTTAALRVRFDPARPIRPQPTPADFFAWARERYPGLPENAATTATVCRLIAARRVKPDATERLVGTSITRLPATIAAIVAEVVADLDLDVTSPAAVAGRCEAVSRALAAALRDGGYHARVVLAWGVGDEPAALRDIADGAIVDGVRVYAYHFVTLVEVGAADSPADAGYSGEWLIDLTAVQYRSTLGWTGPRATFS